MHIDAKFGGFFDAVFIDGILLHPALSQNVINHSPDGFSWGYCGSGSLQLALAILLHAGVSTEQAQACYRQFMTEFIAIQRRSDWTLDIDIIKWVQNHERAVSR